MKPEIFSELRKLRNQVAHGVQHADPTALTHSFAQLGLSVPTANIPSLTQAILNVFGGHGAFYHVPPVLLQVLSKLLEGRSIGVACDPWAGIGEVISVVCGSTHAPKAFAFTLNESELTLGRALVSEAEWKLGPPLQSLESLTGGLDLVLSVLPFGAKSDRTITLMDTGGSPIELRDDLGNLILTAATARLREDGVGLFVIPPSFFFSARSVLHKFSALGFGLEAAFALPSGSFAPHTNIPTYLIVVRKRKVSRMFTAQLSGDSNTNAQIIANFNEGTEGGTLELGRFVDPLSFRGLHSIRIAEQIDRAEKKFGSPAVRIGELAIEINLGRFDTNFVFQTLENAIFVPLIGTSDVVESLEDLTLKRQNYAQVVIEPSRSNARFVARFLNSEFGKEIRDLNKSGSVIPKLSKQTLKYVSIFVPDLRTQKMMLETEARIAAEQNALLGLQNELGAFHRELWTNPRSVSNVNERLNALESRHSGTVKQQATEGLEQWFETLPFPLASIARAWQATPSNDFKTKHEHLLHFFEATAEFTSIILLSAFSSNEGLFAAHKQKISEEMQKQNLSFKRATFGAWKLVVEYLGKQTRQLLSADKDAKAVCGDIFSDPSFDLPQALSSKELAAIFSVTNKMRNDWTGHGGLVGQEEAQLRNEQLVGEVQKLREAFADIWTKTQLVHALHCRPRRGVFENEVSVLKGSNSEFLKETRSMGTYLDVERLYLCNPESAHALSLLPLIQVGPSPQSAKNACYFFSRVERDGGARFISYHFVDKPELKGDFDQAMAAIKLLTEV